MLGQDVIGPAETARGPEGELAMAALLVNPDVTELL